MILDNRGKIRDRLRVQIYDVAAVSWTNTQLDDIINEAAQYVALLIAQHKRVPTVRGEYELDFSQSTTDYRIPVADLHTIFSIESTSDDQNTMFRDEKVVKSTRAKTVDTFNNKGEYVYTLLYDPSGRFSDEFVDDFDVGPGYTLRFMRNPPQGTFMVHYCRTVPTIDSGDSTRDGDSYNMIPKQFMRWILYCSAAMCAVPDMLETGSALGGLWQDIEKKCIEDGRLAPNSMSTA